MPTYDLYCRDCSHYFTVKLSMSERKNARCETCGSSHLEQQFRCCNVLGGKGGTTQSGCSKKGGCGSCTGC